MNKLKLGAMSFLLYLIVEFAFNSAFEAVTGGRLFSYFLLPIADGKTSLVSPLIFAVLVILLFDSFKSAYDSIKGYHNRVLFVGVAVALLGPFYEWMSGTAIRLATGSAYSLYLFLPVLEGYTSLLSPVYFFTVGVAFVYSCRALGFLD
jgi:hypothetical protein